MGVRFPDPDPEKGKSGLDKLRDLANDHKVFSGFAGAVLIVTATLIIALTVGKRENPGPSTSEAGPVVEAPTEPEADPDEDNDGVLNAEDQCSREAGGEPSGCPDSDGDEVVDRLDRCLDEAADTNNGCAPAPAITYLSDVIESSEFEYHETERVETEQITVGGVIDPRGVRMQVGGAYTSGVFSIVTNRRFQTIRGRVGVTSEPCSNGSLGYVAIRNAEGETLWPKGGGLRAVKRDAYPFEVRIAGEDGVALYAQAPETTQEYCGYLPTTEVGWVHTELLAE